MREHFRKEIISFKYMPVLAFLRVLFFVLMLISGYVQWAIVLAGAYFSMGFLFNAEMEIMLPLSDNELKVRRLNRVKFVWLRYWIYGMAGILFEVIMSYRFDLYGLYRQNIPMTIRIAHFILEMIFVLEVFLENVTNEKAESSFRRLFIKDEVHKYFTQSLPHIVYFTYGYTMMIQPNIISDIPVYINLIIISISAVLLIANNIIKVRNWKLHEFRPIEVKVG